ncbi:hypothetical protein [Psychromicrobium lacuslunae]|uniref:Uncharacterized protein n=1 Tax=Psychromicrobium lacuslunae TaxID=1618207 RepID=A0A0D4BXC1_9MICC|nr:hypothetical protein [Psychromicrobium lacuslunae]AJT40973.1 hypothetical protein UM93_04620 [Psychromicrobium lacuslunae]
MTICVSQFNDHSAAFQRETAAPEADFIVLDEAGDFSYHRCQKTLVQAFEAPSEAICIVDRAGLVYGLLHDADRQLKLSASRGLVEFHWLRQAWLRTQNLRPQSYPLHRLSPASSVTLLNGMFEALQLEHSPSIDLAAWTVRLPDATQHPVSLAAVEQSLAELDSLDHVVVQDPFGHCYCPVRHQTHRFLASAAGFISYQEISPSVSSPLSGLSRRG